MRMLLPLTTTTTTTSIVLLSINLSWFDSEANLLFILIIGPCYISLSSVVDDPYANTRTCTHHTHAHTDTHRHCTSLWYKQNSENPRDKQCMKRLSSKWLMYSARSPSGSGLYWQSRMVKALVKVWDRTVWHSSHTTWMTHQTTQHHVPPFKRAIPLNCGNDLFVYEANVKLQLKLSEGE